MCWHGQQPAADTKNYRAASQGHSLSDRGAMLYLFSSNGQPQYAEDVLNALGAPAGYRATFRYDAKYLNESARNSWSELRGDVLIHFVLQQSNEYFTPVLFPVRLGEIIDTRCEGDI